MRLALDRLAPALKQGLAPFYLVAGDEPLQLNEAADAIRQTAKIKGFVNREMFYVDGGFDWHEWLLAADSFSLFNERRLLDLRLAPSKLGKEGAAALLRYMQRPAEDALLLMSMEKLNASVQKSRWFQELERRGVVVQVWPLAGGKLLAWLERRLQSRGLKTDRAGLDILASRVEGNLLSAAQEIDKLYVLRGAGFIDAETIRDGVADSARFNVFDLVDGALKGDAARVDRIVAGLKAEGVAPAVVLWAITRELRLLVQMLERTRRGTALDTLFRQMRVWDARKALLSSALRRLSLPQLHQLLVLSAAVDRLIKGLDKGDPWNALTMLCVRWAVWISR